MINKRIPFLVLVLTIFLVGTAAIETNAADPNEINVQYNGENIVFNNAVPKLVDGRTMVPLRQVLETMGAEVSFEQASNTVYAKTDRLEFSFRIGEADITIINNGETTSRTMDILPFLDQDSNSTYVPVRFMAECMGYKVGFDSDVNTVIIIDPLILYKDANNDFSLIKSISEPPTDEDKPYKIKGTIDMNITSYDDGLNMQAKGDMIGITQKNNSDMIIKLSINLEPLSSMTDGEMDQMRAMQFAMNNMTIQMKINGETGEMYINSNMFAWIDREYNGKTWLKQNIYTGIDTRPGMSYGEIDIAKSLQTNMANLKNIDISTYEDYRTAYFLIKNILGNESFDLRSSAGVDTFTLNLNPAIIEAAINKTLLDLGKTDSSVELEELADDIRDSDFDARMVIKKKGEKLYNYEIKASGAGEDADFSFNLSGNSNSVQLGFVIEEEDEVKASFNVNCSISETSIQPNLELPADAEIIEPDPLDETEKPFRII